MAKEYTLRKRMLFALWGLLLVTLLAPPWYYTRNLTREIYDEAERGAVQQLTLIDWMLARESGLRTLEELNGWLVEVGRQTGTRLTYVADDGKVIADSEVPFAEIPKLDSHASRPEIMQAHDRKLGIVTRYSRTVEKELLYVACRVPAREALPAGVLRLATPSSKVAEPLARLRSSFIAFLALTCVATILLSTALVRRLNRPLQRMLTAVQAISTHDYRSRIRSNPGEELYPLADSINSMADSIESHIRTITEQKQQIEAVFNAMQEGVMVLDSRGRIRSINRAFARLTPSAGQAVGRQPLEVLANIELQRFCDRVLSMAPAEAETQPQTLQMDLSDTRSYEVSIVRLHDEHQGIGAVAVFHDISELKRLERVRQDFVANVSHELRTPLTSIKGYAETLLAEEHPRPEMLSSFLQVILKNTNHMVKMVEDLLQLARLEAHQKGFAAVPVNAASALITAWKACSHTAGNKGLKLEDDLSAERVWVRADFDQLVQVFRNLLENAIRYSPANGVIRVGWEAQKEHLVLSVRDEGPGIPRQHQHRIFERFYRVEKHRSGDSGSTGLGLAICRHIIRNLGGGIWVKSPHSDSSQGTTFLFTLLKAPPALEGPNTEPPSSIPFSPDAEKGQS